MNKLIFKLLVPTFLACLCAAGPPLTKVSFEFLSDGSFEINDGNCSNALVSDQVFHDHVHKTRIPFMIRDGTSEWHGDQSIYCLLAISSKDESKGSTVKVTSGGVGHNYVSLEMHSSRGHGLEYDIQVYGR